ncbi:hypothetical protein GGF31_002641 [Allomyces arbusculus]|nr:hypothetical protein GGF31_002641 [Allomyces arbusculus]
MASSQSWPVESPPRPRKRIQSTLHWALEPLDYDGPNHSHLVAAPKPGKPAASRDRPLPLARVKVRKTAQLTLPADEIASGIPPPLAIPKPTIRPGPDVSQRTGFAPRAKTAGRRPGMRSVNDVDDDDHMRAPAKPKPKPYDVAEVQAFMKKRRLQARQFSVHDTIKDLDKPLHRVPSPPPTATPPTANRTEILQYILKRRERERRERERAQQLHDEAERKRAEQMRALEEFRRRQRVLEAEQQLDAASAVVAMRLDSAGGAVDDTHAPGPSAATPVPVPTTADGAVPIQGPMPLQTEPSPPIIGSVPVLAASPSAVVGPSAFAAPTADSRPPNRPVFADPVQPAAAHSIHQPIHARVVPAPRVDRPAPPLAPPSTRFVPNLGAIAEHQEHDMVADAPSRRRRAVVSPSPLEDLERDLQAILEEDMVVHCETLQSDSTLRVLATSSPEASSLSFGLPPSHPSAPAVVSDPSSSSLHIEPVQTSGTDEDLTDSRESLESTPRASIIGSVQNTSPSARHSHRAAPQLGHRQVGKLPPAQQGHESPSAVFSSRPTSTRPLDLYHPLAVFERTARRAEASTHAGPRTTYDAADDPSMFCSRSPSPRPTAQPHAIKHSMVVLDDTAFLGNGAGALPPRGLSPIAHHQSPRRAPERVHGDRETSFMRDLSHRVIQDHSEEELMAVDRSSSVTPRPLEHLSSSFGEPPRSSEDRDSISTSALVSDAGSFDMAQPVRATVLPPCDVSVGADTRSQLERAPSPTQPVYAPGALTNGMQQSLHYAESLHLADALLVSIEQFRHVAALGGKIPGRTPAHSAVSGHVPQPTANDILPSTASPHTASNRSAPSSDDFRTHSGHPFTPSWASMGRPSAATLEHNGPRSSPPPPVALALNYSEDSAHLAAMVVAATSPILGRTAPVLPPFSDSLLDTFTPVAAAANQASSPVSVPAATPISPAAAPLALPVATCHEAANQTDPLPAPRRDMSVQTDPMPLAAAAAAASPTPSVVSSAGPPALAPATVQANPTDSLKEFLATQFQANQDLIKELVNGQLAQRIRELEAKVEALQHAAVAAAMHPSPRAAASPRIDWVPALPARPFVPLSFSALGAAAFNSVGPVRDHARLPVATLNAAVTLPEPVAVDPAPEMHCDPELDHVLYDWRDRVPSTSGHSLSNGSSPPVERNVRDDDVLTPSLETDQDVRQHSVVEPVDEGTRLAQPFKSLAPVLDEAASSVYDAHPCLPSDDAGDAGGAAPYSPSSHSLTGSAHDVQGEDSVRVALNDADHRPLMSGIDSIDLTMSLTLSPRKPDHHHEVGPNAARAPLYFEPMSVMSEPFAPTKSLLEALRNPSDSSISSLSVSAISDGDIHCDRSDAVPESIVSSVVVSVVAEDAEIDHDERGLRDVAVLGAALDAAVGGVDARRVLAVQVQDVEEIDESYPSSLAASLVASSVPSQSSQAVVESVATADAGSGTDSVSSVATSAPLIEASVVTEGSAVLSRMTGRNMETEVDESLAVASVSGVEDSVLSGNRATGSHGDVSVVKSEADSVAESERSASGGSVLERDFDQDSIAVEQHLVTASSIPPSVVPSSGDPGSHLPSTHGPESGHKSAADTSIVSRISPAPSHSSKSQTSTPSLSSRARTEPAASVAVLQDDGHDGTSFASSVAESSVIASVQDQSRETIAEEPSSSLDGPQSCSSPASHSSTTSPSRLTSSRSHSTVSDPAVDEDAGLRLDDSAASVLATTTTATLSVPIPDRATATSSNGDEPGATSSARSAGHLPTAENQGATEVYAHSRSSSIHDDAPSAPNTSAPNIHDDAATSVATPPSVATTVSIGLVSSQRSLSSVHEAMSDQSAPSNNDDATENDVTVSDSRSTGPDAELASSIGLPKSTAASSSSISDVSDSESHSADPGVELASSIGLPKSVAASLLSIADAVLSHGTSVANDDASDSISSVFDGDQASSRLASDATASSVEDGAAEQPSVSVATDREISAADLSLPAQESRVPIISDVDRSAISSISLSAVGTGPVPAPTLDPLLAAAQHSPPTDASVATTASSGPASQTIVSDHSDALSTASRSSDAMPHSSARKSVSGHSQLTEATGLETSIAESLDGSNSSRSTDHSASAEPAAQCMPHGRDDLGSAIGAPPESASLPARLESVDAPTRSLPAEPSITAADSTSLVAPRDSVTTVTQGVLADHLDDATSDSVSVTYSIEFDHDEPGHDDTGLAAFRDLGEDQDGDQSHVVLGARPDGAHGAGDASSIMDMSSVMPTLHEIQAVPEHDEEGVMSSSMRSPQRSRLGEDPTSPSMDSSQQSLVDDASDAATASRSSVQSGSHETAPSGSHDHSGSIMSEAGDMSYVASSFEDFSQESVDEEAISPPISPLPILASVPDRSEQLAAVPNPEAVPIHERVKDTTVPVETASPVANTGYPPLTPDQIAQNNLLAAAATEQLLDTLLHEVASEMASLHPSLQAKPPTKSPTAAAAVAVAPHMDVDYARNYLRFLLVHYHDTVHRTTPLVAAPHPVYRHAAWNALLAAAADEARNHLFQRLGPSAWNAAVPAHWLYNEIVAVVAKNVQFAVDHAELDVVGMLTDDLRIEAAEARAQQQQQQPQQTSTVSVVPANSPPITVLRDTNGTPAEHIAVGNELTGSEHVGNYESWRRDKVDVAVDDLLDQLIFESVLGTTSLMAGIGTITPEQASRHV